MPREEDANPKHLMLTASELIRSNDDDEEDEALKALDSMKCSEFKQCVHCSDNMTTLAKTIRSTLLEIHAMKERERERRHLELIDRLGNYLGNDGLRCAEVTRNIKVEKGTSASAITHKSNEAISKCVEDEFIQISNNPKTSNTTNKSSNPPIAAMRKRQAPNPTNNINGSNACDTPPKKLIKPDISQWNQRDELATMRQQMLEMQRRKMEERERKKLENSHT